MSTQSWELRSGEKTLGVLSLVLIDQPWFRCEFTPGEGWENVSHLFEAQADAVDSGNEKQMMDAMSAVRKLPLKLYHLESGEIIIPVIMQIRDDKANFRY